MAGITAIPDREPFQCRPFFDDDTDGATLNNDIDNGPTQLLAGFMTNADAALVYLQMWDNRTPVLGTTGQDWQIPCAASDSFEFVIIRGGRMATALSFGATSDRGTAANTDPTTPIDTWLVTSGGVHRGLGVEEVVPETTPSGAALTRSIIAKLGSTAFRDREADNNLRVITASAGTLYGVRLDNRLNTVKSFFKCYDAAAPTIGTTVPDLIIPAAAQEELIIVFPKGMAMSTAMRYGVVTTGGTAGTTSPANPVELEAYI